MIDYTCPKCGQPMSSPEGLAGRTETCPSCGSVVAVSGPGALAEEASSGQARPGGLWRTGLVANLAKCLCVVIGCLLFYLAIRQDSAIKMAALAGMACFAGIVGRLMQAEQHHAQRMRWKQ